jgi:putative phosphoribosyl transferase
MSFSNREDAGRKLAERLKAYASPKDVTVLAIPRGGVPVAYEIAKTLGVPLDVFVARKLGVPGEEELGFGAIASGGVLILDPEIIKAMALSETQIADVTARERRELERRERVYRGARTPLDIAGRTVILVDDGIATGSSMLAVISAVRQLKPARIVVAVPVAASDACRRLAPEVDELVCVERPRFFGAIGEFYEDFSQVADEEVAGLLARGLRRSVSREV